MAARDPNASVAAESTRDSRARQLRPAAERATVRENTRTRLVRRGLELLTEQAFDATGIDQILAELGVPRGSFYHFFPSKQAYCEAVVDGYAAYFDDKFDRFLGNTERLPLDRLRDYLADCTAGMARHQWRRGCLVGNLAQELGGRNDALRQRLESVLLGWQSRVADCLREAIDCGELEPTADPERLAQFFWIGWEGALMRAKLTRDSSPLDCFVELYFALLPLRRRRASRTR